MPFAKVEVAEVLCTSREAVVEIPPLKLEVAAARIVVVAVVPMAKALWYISSPHAIDEDAEVEVAVSRAGVRTPNTSEFRFAKLVFMVARESLIVSVAAIVVIEAPKFCSTFGPNCSIKDKGK